MALVPLGALQVDLCSGCSGVWFDAGELGTLHELQELPAISPEAMLPEGVEDEEFTAVDLVLTVLSLLL